MSKKLKNQFDDAVVKRSDLDITQDNMLKKTINTLQQERQLYRDALLHNCDYAYIVNVNENRFYDIYKGDFLEQYFFDTTRPYDEVMERVVEKMQPVIFPNNEQFHLTSHYIAAYEQGKRIIEVEYYAPNADVYKKKSILLSKNENGIIYAFVVAHDITKSRKEFLEKQAALKQLAETAKKVGDGDLDVVFNRDAPGEVGILADVLNQTIFRLTWYMNKLKEQITQDPMTGVKNKRAWQEAERRLNEQILVGTAEFAVVVCDINKLKTINDTIGHEAGDGLILRASRHICKIFSHSPVYRISGDEFAVILERDDLSDCERLLREFDLGMAGQAKDNPTEPPFSIALGISHYQPEDTCFAETIRRADKAMYQKKAAMKAE